MWLTEFTVLLYVVMVLKFIGCMGVFIGVMAVFISYSFLCYYIHNTKYVRL